MAEITIELPDELYAKARRLADKRGQPVAEFVCDVLKAKVAEGEPDERPRPKPRLALFASGRSDISERIGEEGLPGLHPWRS